LKLTFVQWSTFNSFTSSKGGNSDEKECWRKRQVDPDYSGNHSFPGVVFKIHPS